MSSPTRPVQAVRTRIPRRALFSLPPLAFSSCGRTGNYFGDPAPRTTQRLVYELPSEPETLDPGKSNAASESDVIPSLFEALIFPHPRTSRPLAGIATHYAVNGNFREFVFYLRGHHKPRGVALPTVTGLDFSRGLPPSDTRVAARWSDGIAVTAHDFVYSWRRNLVPQTASPFASFLYYLENAQEINAGRRPAEDLGVEAVDDFTLRVTMHSPAPFFLDLQENFCYYAVPRHREKNWDCPARMVTSGAFRVREWKPYDRLTLVPNPHYYDARQVALRELVFLPVADGATNLNLYKAGDADSMLTKAVAPSFLPLLRGKKDFQTAPAYWSMFYTINTTQAPFQDVRVRYALNMAIDKKAIAAFLGAGQIAAAGLLPPLEGYSRPRSLLAPVDGDQHDVLSYNPLVARRLLRQAGAEGLRLRILYPALPSSREVPLILQQQWRRNLGIEVELETSEEAVFHPRRNRLEYSGVAERGWFGDYLDPNTFLETFLSGPSVIGTGWTDPVFDNMLREANAAPPVERMKRLVSCEEHLLRAMPVLPLYYNVQSVLSKPYVRGLPPIRVGSVRFKYAWIDTNWRPN